jgi:hypothetical protein
VDDPNRIAKPPSPLVEITEPSAEEIASLRAFWTFLSKERAQIADLLRGGALKEQPSLAFDPLELLASPLTPLVESAITDGAWHPLYE